MPEIIAPTSTIETPTASTEPTGSPFDAAETTHQELSPADLGLNIKLDAPSEKPADPTRQPLPAPTQPPDDVIGKALKRGRPARDLSDLNENEREIFQNMALQGYETLYPFYKKFRGRDADLESVDKLKAELETLKKNPPASFYYDHEDAYLLQNDYREALMAGHQLNTIADHWEQQYINARAGKPIRDLVLDQNGRPQLGGEIQPSPEVEAKIFSLLADAKQKASSHQSRLESIRSDHGQKFKSFKEQMTLAYQKMIGPYEAQLKPMMEKHLQMFPEFVRNRQEIQAIAGLYALLQHVVNNDKVDKQQQVAATANRTAARSAGPTARSITTAPKGSNSMTSAEEEREMRLRFGI